MTMCITGDKVAFGDKRSVKHVRKVVCVRRRMNPLLMANLSHERGEVIAARTT
jgi:hypothetical protein